MKYTILTVFRDNTENYYIADGEQDRDDFIENCKNYSEIKKIICVSSNGTKQYK